MVLYYLCGAVFANKTVVIELLPREVAQEAMVPMNSFHGV